MAFTWQGRTPAAKTAAFCTSVVPIALLMCSQSLKENLFRFPIISDVYNAPIRNYRANITRQFSCLEPSMFLAREFCSMLRNMPVSHLVSYGAETLLWEERSFFLLRYLLHINCIYWYLFLGPCVGWISLEEVTDLHTASLCWWWWHLALKVIHPCLSSISTTGELQGANICEIARDEQHFKSREPFGCQNCNVPSEKQNHPQ